MTPKMREFNCVCQANGLKSTDDINSMAFNARRAGGKENDPDSAAGLRDTASEIVESKSERAEWLSKPEDNEDCGPRRDESKGSRKGMRKIERRGEKSDAGLLNGVAWGHPSNMLECYGYTNGTGVRALQDEKRGKGKGDTASMGRLHRRTSKSLKIG
ncbi:hypothetical protein B0H14DRAFT_2562658 [Mycena olivaceomarginata]|nr:hypothetical protein B0H14DRAFT_2562658 [Mycena olivaceomarginata]